MNSQNKHQLKSFFSATESQPLTQLQLDYLTDLVALLGIKSIKDEVTASDVAPFGIGNKQALEFMLKIAQRDGFTTCNVDNVAGHIEWGQGDEIIGVIGHLDVVPAEDNWSVTQPFKPLIKDGYLYARGVSDDKGPMLAAYYAIKQLAQQNIIANKRIRLIFGTDEESDWQCVKAYFAQQPKPQIGFSPDSQFPIVNSEKGSVSMQLDFAKEDSGLQSFHSGEKRNVVPEQASATIHLPANQASQTKQQFIDFIKQEQLNGEMRYDEIKQQAIFYLVGKSCHGSQPEHGHNAGTYLAYWLANILPDSIFLRFIAKKLHLNFTGDRLANINDKTKYAQTSLNIGVMRFSQQHSWLQLNFRYSAELDQEQIFSQVTSSCSPLISCQIIGQPKSPHFVAENSQLVTRLKEAYHSVTGNEAYCITAGGGTFARLFDNCVGFGALFPDDEDTMHQIDEKSKLNHLFMTIDIYTQALKNLLVIN